MNSKKNRHTYIVFKKMNWHRVKCVDPIATCLFIKMPQIAKKNTHCVANRSGGMERSCNYLLRISQNKKKSFKKRKKGNFKYSHSASRCSLFSLFCWCCASDRTRRLHINFAAIFFALNVKGRKKKSKHPHTCDQLGLKFP